MAEEPKYEATLRDQKDEKGGSWWAARVDADGDLVLEGYDHGEFVEEFWGDSDYEYVRLVKAEHVPKVLVELIRDRFRTDSEFGTWLTEKGVHNEFQSWV